MTIDDILRDRGEVVPNGAGLGERAGLKRFRITHLREGQFETLLAVAVRDLLHRGWQIIDRLVRAVDFFLRQLLFGRVVVGEPQL